MSWEKNYHYNYKAKAISTIPLISSKNFFRSKNKFAWERMGKEGFSSTISAVFIQFKKKTLEKKICDRMVPNFNYKS